MILRTCLCIPTYNNPTTIESVVFDALTQTRFPVLVIDDGSDQDVKSLIEAPRRELRDPEVIASAFRSGRLTVVRHEKNLGKGVAIQTAFREALARDFTHLITIDGDGQHLVSELSKLVPVMVENPWDLILGNRHMIGETVPEVSKFGRKFSNFWVKYETDQKIADSQSGFRIYPLFHVQNLKFFTKRFDFEIEVLIRLMWKGVRIREVEMNVYYPPPAERVSHFDKLWDNVRISTLNTLLVVVSLFRANKSALKESIALGVGVFVGCTPLYGLHTVIVGGLSVVFKLNFVFALIGTQVSFPPLAPFIVFASVELGKHFGTGWIFGSLILGGILGLTTTLVSYVVMKGIEKGRKKKSSWSGKTRGGVLGNWFLKTMTKTIGGKNTYFFLYFIIPYFYLFAPTARRSGNEYWKTVRPEAGFFERQGLVMKQLFVFGQVLLDRLYQSFHASNKFTLKSTGNEHIINTVAAKQGLVMLGAHVGGWDLASRSLKDNGYMNGFTTVQYEASGLTFNKVKVQNDAEKLRLLSISDQSTENRPVFNVRESLSQGLPVGFMADRPVGNHYELVTFFGKLAAMDTSPFRIAASCESLLLFTFGYKGQGNTYDFFATPPRRYFYPATPVEAVNGGAEKVLFGQRWLQEFATELETSLSSYPLQWFNFYPFWSTPPQAPEGVDVGKVRHFLLEDLKK